MQRTLLTAGCSLTKDNYQSTWADYLSQALDFDLVNIAARGAGIEFIAKRTMYQCLQQRTDLVLLMLPSLDRFDWYLTDNHPLRKHATSISSWQNGLNPELVEIDGSLSTNSGYSLTGGEIRGYKKYWYKYFYTESATVINYWHTVYNLENFFKINNIKYYFTMAYNRDDLIEQAYNKTGASTNHKFLFDVIDWDQFIFYKNTCGFLEFTKDNQFSFNTHYPESLAHSEWVNQILLPKIK